MKSYYENRFETEKPKFKFRMQLSSEENSLWEPASKGPLAGLAKVKQIHPDCIVFSRLALNVFHLKIPLYDLAPFLVHFTPFFYTLEFSYLKIFNVDNETPN